MNTEALIEALRRELDGYVRRGMAARAESVRQELVRLGCSPGDTPSEVVPVESDGTPPPRKAKPKPPVDNTPPPSSKRKRANS